MKYTSNIQHTISTSETANYYQFTITFEQPFRVTDPDAWSSARAYIVLFIKLNRIPYKTLGKTKRTSPFSFVLIARK